MRWNRNDGIVVLVAEREVRGAQSNQILPGCLVTSVFKTEQGVEEYQCRSDRRRRHVLDNNGTGFQTEAAKMIGPSLCAEGTDATRA